MTFTSDQKDLLGKKLDPKFVKPPPPGKFGDYIEGWHAIAEANRIFDFDGWSSSVSQILQTNCEQRGDKKWAVGWMAIVSVTAGDVTKEDVGHGAGIMGSLGDAHQSAIKEAVTDGLKRALRQFGWPFGLALYDKTKEHVGVDNDPPPVDKKSAYQLKKDAAGGGDDDWGKFMDGLVKCNTLDRLDKLEARAKQVLYPIWPHGYVESATEEIDKVRKFLTEAKEVFK